MKRNLMIICLLFTLLTITGCGKETKKDKIDVDTKRENVLACTSMKYNIFGDSSSEITEDHLFIAEYDDSKTNIISAQEIYTADYSKTGKKLTEDDLEKVKEQFKTKFCDIRKTLITPNGYEGEKVPCDIKYEDDVVTVKMIYPKDAIEYAKSKNKLGTLEELKQKLEANSMVWFYNNYFTCDKNYDKSKLINKEIKKTLTLNYNGSYNESHELLGVTNELNAYQRFVGKVFEKYKLDTNNRITLEPNNEEENYISGDYILTYECVADSEETCNEVADFVIDSFAERAKDFHVTVTRK